MYCDAVRNPKVARLADKDFRLWIELLSVAAERDGLIPPLDDLKHLLRRRLDHLSSAVDRLISGGLIVALEDGYEPNDWNEYQYKSDISTDRVRKHREKRNVSVTSPESDTDTETESEEETDVSSGTRHAAQQFVDVWNETAVPVGLTRCAAITSKRMPSFKARLKDHGIEAMLEAIRKVPTSRFLRGESGDWSGANIEFFLRPDSVTKILEGKYDDRIRPDKPPRDNRDGFLRSLDRDLGYG